MIINRHNYEDYFILYLDNELDATGRKAVEDFLAANPDLQPEMESFRQAIMSPDETLVFDQKERLLVNENNINVHNYTGYLVAYMDSELQPGESDAVEQYLVTHPEAATELKLLQRTRLQADEKIVFAHKENLYRYEKVHDIKPAAWWRVAAAAVIILGLGAGGYLLSEDQQDTTNSGYANNIKKEITKPAEVNKNPASENNLVDGINEAAQTSDHDQATKQQTVLYANAVSSKQIPGNTKEHVTSNQQDLEKPIGIPVSVNDLTPGNKIVYNELQQQNINDVAVTNEINTAYNPKASTETNQIMYAADMEQDNKKIRGFFRKATRIIERTTNITATNEDDKLLVGAFAINLK